MEYRKPEAMPVMDPVAAIQTSAGLLRSGVPCTFRYGPENPIERVG